MGIQTWVVIGIVAGLAVRWRMPSNGPENYATALVLGICGGVAGGFLSTFAGMGGISEFDVGSSLAALAGALVALFASPSVTSRVASRLRPKKQQNESAEAPAAAEPEPEDQLVS